MRNDKHPAIFIVLNGRKGALKTTASYLRLTSQEEQLGNLFIFKRSKRAQRRPPFLFSLTSQKGKNTRQSFHILRVRKEIKGDSGMGSFLHKIEPWRTLLGFGFMFTQA